MSSIIQSTKIRAKLDRPSPGHDCPTNSSQVRRLIHKLMSPNDVNEQRLRLLRLAAIPALACMIIAGTATFGRWASPNAFEHASKIAATTQEPAVMLKTYTGTVLPAKKSELGFPQVGRLKRLWVKEGDIVEPGQLLAELDTESIEAELSVAKSELKLALSQLGQRPAGASSGRRTFPSTLDRRSVSTDPASLTKDRWESVIRQLEAQRESCRLHAPYRALVVETQLSDGSAITPERTVLKIVSHEEIVVKVSVPAKLTNHLKNQESFTFLVGRQKFIGRLQGIVPDSNASGPITACFGVAGLTSTDMSTSTTLQLSIPARSKLLRDL